MSTLTKIIIAIGIIIISIGGWLLLNKKTPPVEIPTEKVPVEIEELVITPPPSPIKVIGNSVQSRPIESYTFGKGSTTLLFVGGVHGGYEWNSSALAYQFIDEITAGTFTVPDDLTLVIVPTLNPDGLFAATNIEGRFTDADVVTDSSAPLGTGRLNAHDVDLNRNFDCKWQPKSTWQSKVVSAGTAPFSEPEAVALRDLVFSAKPVAVIFWHSQSNTVYGSECQNGVLKDTITLMNTYALAANYKTLVSFTAYPITGDAEGWLASLGIPAVTVELETHKTSEWTRNRAGIAAVLDKYTKVK